MILAQLERVLITQQGKEIYEAHEWEVVRPQIPHSMRNSFSQPTMIRKQRRAMAANQRKGGEQPKKTQTIH